MLRRFGLSLLLLLSLATFCHAVEPAMKADPSYGVRYVAERVVSLPQDESKMYLTLFGNPKDAEYKQVKSWFKNNDALAAIKDQTFYNEIDTTSLMYRDRYKSSVPAGTLVRFQDADGNPLSDFGDNADHKLPMSADALAKALNGTATNASAECFRKHHEEEKPDPSGQPLEQAPPVSHETTGVMVLVGFVCFLAALCGFFLGLKKEYHHRSHH